MSSHYYCSCDKRWNDDESCPACHPNDFIAKEKIESFIYNFECDEKCQCCMNNKAILEDLTK